MQQLKFEAELAYPHDPPAVPTQAKLAEFLETIDTGGLEILVSKYPGNIFCVEGTDARIFGTLPSKIIVRFNDETVGLAKFARTFLERLYAPGTLAAIITYAFLPSPQTHYIFGVKSLYLSSYLTNEQLEELLPDFRGHTAILWVSYNGKECARIIAEYYDGKEYLPFCAGYTLYPNPALEEQMAQL